MEKMIIRSVRNAHGCKIKKCCASCQHKCIESDGMKNAGKGGGVVRLIGTQEIVID